MEIPLRAALVAWLAADPVLGNQLNAVVEEAPSRSTLPWLAIAATASADWSSKSGPGREVRLGPAALGPQHAQAVLQGPLA